jgi:ATP-dependent helicase STH1/SNF2
MESIALAALPRESDSDSEESSVTTDASAAQTRVVQEQHGKQKHGPLSRPNSSASNRRADKHRKTLQTSLQDVYEALMNLESESDSDCEEGDKDQDKRLIIGLFVELPPKKSFPVDYVIIRKPISMKMVERKIKTEEYSSLDDLRDIKLLCLNAKTYNEDGSMIYVDATVIEVSPTGNVSRYLH